MTTPRLATAAAAIAIWSGVAETSFCPKPAMANAGVLRSKKLTGGKKLLAGLGRSMGTVWLKPKASDVETIASALASTAVWAKGMLQLRRNTSSKSPPQVVPPKFSIGLSVNGGVHDDES